MIRRFIVSLFSLTLLFSLAVPITVFAADNSKNAACETISELNPNGGSCDRPGGTTVRRVVRLALNALSLIAGVIAVIMLIVSGLKFVTSTGDASQAVSARNTLIYAIVGLVIVVMAQAIVRFVLGETT